MAELSEIGVHLSKNQLDKLRRGHRIQISGGALDGPHRLLVKSHNLKRIERARKANKGVRIQLDEEEIDGSGLKEILKKGWDYYQKNIKPKVSNTVRNVLTQTVEKGIPAVLTALGQPELAVPAAALAHKFAGKAVNYIGDHTHAFGLQGGGAIILSKPGTYTIHLQEGPKKGKGKKGGSFMLA